MKNVFITTIIGPDSPDVIKSLAHVTRENGGEWLTSKVIKLDGQFSAMMKVVAEKDQESALKAALEAKFPALSFVYTAALSQSGEPLKTINLVVDCQNRVGLTHDINETMAALGLVIESMDLHRFQVSGIGEAVYSNRLAVSVPEGTNAEDVAGKLEEIPGGVRVHVL